MNKNKSLLLHITFMLSSSLRLEQGGLWKYRKMFSSSTVSAHDKYYKNVTCQELEADLVKISQNV